MATDPRNVRGSDADVAEAGLDPEASFAEVDEATAHRLSQEAAAVAEAGGREAGARAAGAREAGSRWATDGGNQAPGETEEISAVEMLTRPVDGGLQDAPRVDGYTRPPGQDLHGSEEPLQTNPDQEGPPGAAQDGAPGR